MRRFLLALVLVGLVGVVVWGDCNCPPQDPAAPPCYTAFFACETVFFKLVVPGEFLALPGISSTPLVTGWRIENLDGISVFQDLFPSVPLGAWYQMSWNQRDSSWNPVSPGYYRVVIQTTSAGEFAGFVQIVERPALFSWSPMRLCSRPCCPVCGTPSVAIERDKSLDCGCTVSLVVNPCCGCGCH